MAQIKSNGIVIDKANIGHSAVFSIKPTKAQPLPVQRSVRSAPHLQGHISEVMVKNELHWLASWKV